MSFMNNIRVILDHPHITWWVYKIHKPNKEPKYLLIHLNTKNNFEWELKIYPTNSALKNSQQLTCSYLFKDTIAKILHLSFHFKDNAFIIWVGSYFF
jgi:hypothetical protein